MSHDTLKARLSDSVKDAMRAKATDRLATLRFLLAAIKQREVDERRELSDAEITAVIEKQVKQRRESIAAFEQAGRTETAEHEKKWPPPSMPRWPKSARKASRARPPWARSWPS
ncbi:Uncharacterized conserved protein [Bordetella pertussis]|nr:Uncharacterized conserved protein [Bordetella pertussis]